MTKETQKQFSVDDLNKALEEAQYLILNALLVNYPKNEPHRLPTKAPKISQDLIQTQTAEIAVPQGIDETQTAKIAVVNQETIPEEVFTLDTLIDLASAHQEARTLISLLEALKQHNEANKDILYFLALRLCISQEIKPEDVDMYQTLISQDAKGMELKNKIDISNEGVIKVKSKIRVLNDRRKIRVSKNTSINKDHTYRYFRQDILALQLLYHLGLIKLPSAAYANTSM